MSAGRLSGNVSPMNSRMGPRLQILTAAVLFSTGGAAIKACALTGAQVASFRSGVAALTLLILAPGSRRFLRPRSLLVGTAYAACLTLFVVANKNTTAANTIFLQSVAPLYMLLLSPWLLKEPVHRRDLYLMAALGLGMALLVLGSPMSQRTAPHPALGNGLAIASGVFWALTVVGLRWMGRGSDPESATATSAVVAGNLIAFLAGLVFALPVASSTAMDWTTIIYLGVVQIGIAYLCLTSALRRVPALDAALLLLVEPVLNPLWAWWIHGETPGVWSCAGGAVILAGTLLHASRS